MRKICFDGARAKRAKLAPGRAVFALAGAAALFLVAAAVDAGAALAETAVAVKSEKADPAQPGGMKTVQGGDRRSRGERRKKARRRVKGGHSKHVETGADLSPAVSVGVGAGGPAGGW